MHVSICALIKNRNFVRYELIVHIVFAEMNICIFSNFDTRIFTIHYFYILHIYSLVKMYSKNQSVRLNCVDGLHGNIIVCLAFYSQQFCGMIIFKMVFY
jgi:hypothetical protein